jgi:shikimate dehydrogenase
MKKYGLIGFPLTHSFSSGYFTRKFTEANISDAVYENFPIESVGDFENLIQTQPDLIGLNVTIPYKEKIIPYLDELDKTAKEIDAVNTIKFITNSDGRRILKGYNTDVYGFESAIRPYLKSTREKALILGTGGSSKAVVFILRKLGISCDYVSRKSADPIFKTYEELTSDDLQDYQLIINTTPLGMFPKTDECPRIPYSGITSKHVLFDLIYNPAETLFLARGKAQGAVTMNGLKMLHLQAEKSWEIWNS